MSQRTEKVGDLLRSELARIIQREVRDPRVGLATVAGVEVSGDLSHAEVRISVLGDDETRAASILALQSAKGFIRTCLARSVRLRTVPELAFKLDRGAEHSQRISDILESLYGDVEGS
ncbi:MAG: 30S ribosome-binding factor RbfA [bacterium]|nr:30S ribosome-binding factor RbfA [bacterium]